MSVIMFKDITITTKHTSLLQKVVSMEVCSMVEPDISEDTKGIKEKWWAHRHAECTPSPQDTEEGFLP